MKKFTTVFGLLSLMLLLTSFTSPIGGRGQVNTGNFEIGGRGEVGTGNFEIGGRGEVGTGN